MRAAAAHKTERSNRNPIYGVFDILLFTDELLRYTHYLPSNLLEKLQFMFAHSSCSIAYNHGVAIPMNT